jgi:hypothetical protein
LLPGTHALYVSGTGNVSVRVERGRARVQVGESVAGTSRRLPPAQRRTQLDPMQLFSR